VLFGIMWRMIVRFQHLLDLSDPFPSYISTPVHHELDLAPGPDFAWETGFPDNGDFVVNL
jgi:hypothetical protein